MNNTINNIVRKASLYFVLAMTLLVVVAMTSTKTKAQNEATYVTSSTLPTIYTIDSNTTSLNIKVSSNTEVVFVYTNSKRVVIETQANIYSSNNVYSQLAELGKYKFDALHGMTNDLNISMTDKASHYIKSTDGLIIQERIYVKMYVPNFIKTIHLES